MQDGSPQVTPVWFSIDGKYILINTARGRTKDRNMQANPRVAIAILDPNDPYRHLQIRGRVIEDTEDGAVDHIKQLGVIYMGKPFEFPADQVRVIYKIRIDHVTTMG